MMYCGILYCTRVCAILFEIFAWSLDNIKYIGKKFWTKSETMVLNFENHYMKKNVEWNDKKLELVKIIFSKIATDSHPLLSQ